MFSRIRSLTLLAATLGILPMTAGATPARAQGTIELELATEPGFPLVQSQEWVKLFADLGVASVRIRARQAGDTVAVSTRGAPRSPVYHVTGVLTARGAVQLPGGAFTPQQSKRIGEWLKALALHGPDAKPEEKTVFGLTAKQFAAVNGDLAQTVDFSTKDGRVGDVVTRIQRPLKHRLAVDATAKEALAGQGKVLDELKGLSSGTALAAVLRPEGLIVLPRQRGADVELAITTGRDATGRDAKELWPIGWESDKAPGKLIPGLVEQINVEVDGATAAKTLDAVRGRLKVPFLYDYNALAELDLDLTKAKAKVPAGRLAYSAILKHTLYHNRLKYEVRVDEAGKPFLWITH